MQLVQASPQFFGQSFSSSSFVNSDGEVVLNTIYTDSDGNRVINGVNEPTKSGLASAAIVSKETPKITKNTNIASRPDWNAASGSKKPVNSGAYVPDNSGKYKGN